MSIPSRARSADYVPRRPHDTVLYRIVQQHLATFLEHTERTYAAPLPKYVVDTFEHLLAGRRLLLADAKWTMLGSDDGHR